MQSREELIEAVNAYLRGQTADLRLPWSVHLDYFGGQQEPQMYPDHDLGEERLGYNRMAIWLLRDADGAKVMAGVQQLQLSLSDSIIYDECLHDLPEGAESDFRDRLQRVADAMNALSDPCAPEG